MTSPHVPPPPPPSTLDFQATPEFRAMVRNVISEILTDFITTQEKRAGQISLTNVSCVSRKPSDPTYS